MQLGVSGGAVSPPKKFFDIMPVPGAFLGQWSLDIRTYFLAYSVLHRMTDQSACVRVCNSLFLIMFMLFTKAVLWQCFYTESYKGIRNMYF